jgi:2-oxo-3-hexenedioate decarboxylase
MIEARQIADELGVAERERTPLPPFTDAHPDLDLDTAYAAQRLVVQRRLDAGERFVGFKLGLTSRAKQQAMGVTEPLFGRVTSAMVATYGESVDTENLIQPRGEPEIAFLLAREVAGPAATVTSVLAATEVVFGAIDVLDSRYQDYRFQLADVVADNASAGRFLLGPQARSPGQLVDLGLLGCVLRANGAVVATAAGAATMGHPAAAVAWLANRLAENDEALPAGALVFSGGLTAPIPLRAGVAVSAEFDGLGQVEAFASAR